MADSTERDNLPQATVVPRRRMRISIVWIIPLLAALVAIGIAIQRIRSEGPTITISFKAAEGVEAGCSVPPQLGRIEDDGGLDAIPVVVDRLVPGAQYPANGRHRIDRLDAGLERLIDRLTSGNARRRELDKTRLV